MKLKKTTSLLLALALICAFALPVGAAGLGMANFDPHAVTYRYGQFPDVNEGLWYGADGQGVVASACGLGLMKGTGDGFSPDGSLTVAQTVTAAARLLSTYKGDDYSFVQGEPWYECYVDYAEAQGILSAGEFSGDMQRAATRAEMAYIFSRALPAKELPAINDIDTIPDVPESHRYYSAVKGLYAAGILTGNDVYGTFTPDESITRAAASAIITRMALPEQRRSFTLESASAAFSLDYSHYAVSKPASVNSYQDFVGAWSWMLVNSVFEQSFPSGIQCKEGSIDMYQKAAIEAFNYVATLEYFDYSSFRRSVRINTSYNYDQAGNCSDIKFKLTLRNVDGISDATIKSQVTAFEDSCAEIVTNLYKSGALKTTMTNKQKAYVLYRYVATHNKYDESYSYYSAYDAAVRGTSVCQGYAGMYSYLCNLAGVPMRGMTGQSDGSSHAWNRIYENGQWYHVDTTYADPVPDTPGYCDDAWFWLTEQQIRTGSSQRTLDTDKIMYAESFSGSAAAGGAVAEAA